MVLFKICVVLFLFFSMCFSQSSDPQDIENSVPKTNNIIANEVVITGAETSILKINLSPINWYESLLDVMDPWFWFHIYQPEVQTVSPNFVRGLPSWYNSLLNVLDPWCWFHTRGISMETRDG